ncbi:Rv3654c family TadE-like protein [Mycolicibacterium palauense]|uniref:Rv3654c family TadE-like protein n=1 Tax=Mycolicibacterium palauense TaxID=2034511 RepID=UPI002E23A979
MTALAMTQLGAVVVARHRAQAAADLAALAAAAGLPAGPGTACEGGAAIARAMRAVQVGCDVEDLDVVVTVEVPLRGIWGVSGPARAGARAGPGRGPAQRAASSSSVGSRMTISPA